jgi:hypothetical protein
MEQTSQRKSLKKLTVKEETKKSPLKKFDYKLDTPSKPSGDFQFRNPNSSKSENSDSEKNGSKMNERKLKDTIIGYSLIAFGWILIVLTILINFGFFENSVFFKSYVSEIGHFVLLSTVFAFFSHTGIKIFKHN